MERILDVTYVSVWDGGYEIESNAKYDTQSKVVFDIEVVEGIDEDGDEVQVLDEEYILLPNGEKLGVYEQDGEYKTKPPMLRFRGDIEAVDAFCKELDSLMLKENEMEVYGSHPGEVKVEPLHFEDYEWIEETAKKYNLRVF